MIWEEVVDKNIHFYLKLINTFLASSVPLEPISNYIKIRGGFAFKSNKYSTTGVPVIRISDFDHEEIVLTSVKHYNESPDLVKFELYEGDVIIAMTGGTIGKLAIVQKGLGKLYVNQRVGKFEIADTEVFEGEYIYWIAKSIQREVQNLGYGGAQPNVSGSQIEKIRLPFPSKATQKKVNSFLADFKNNNLKQSEYFDRTVECEIIQYQNLSIALQNLKIQLQKQLQNVADLRRAAVMEAVSGKFHTKNYHDEPAAFLLERIKNYKATLVGRNKTKIEKKLSNILIEEIPFEVPNNWIWCRIGEISDIKGGVTLGKNYSGELFEIPYLRVANVQRGFVDVTNVKTLRLPNLEILKNKLEKDDLLIVEGGDFDKVGRCAIWNGTIENCSHQNHIFRLRFYLEINHKWGELFINSPIARKYFESCSKQTTNLASINKTQLSNLVFPLPPIAEQERILNRIEIIRNLCDKMEATVCQQLVDVESLFRTISTRKPEIEDIQMVEEKNPNMLEKTLLLSAEIIWQLQKQKTLGHVKLQKLIYLCDKTNAMNLPVNFLKQAMGPYDPKLQRYLDAELEGKRWFKYDEAQTLKYQPLANAGDHKLPFKAEFGEQIESIYHLIQLFENTNSAKIEIVATLFACWEDMILNNQLVNDASLLSKFYDWSEFKGNYSAEQVKSALRWMESNSIVPQQSAILN